MDGDDRMSKLHYTADPYRLTDKSQDQTSSKPLHTLIAKEFHFVISVFCLTVNLHLPLQSFHIGKK